ncbi:hypothetical protein AAHE18_10G252100 [Arachis hypogaea]
MREIRKKLARFELVRVCVCVWDINLVTRKINASRVDMSFPASHDYAIAETHMAWPDAVAMQVRGAKMISYNSQMAMHRISSLLTSHSPGLGSPLLSTSIFLFFFSYILLIVIINNCHKKQ